MIPKNETTYFSAVYPDKFVIAKFEVLETFPTNNTKNK